MKCKPIPMSQMLQDDTPLDAFIRLLVTVDGTLKDKEYFLCGNCNGNTLTYDKTNKNKPKVCSRCECVVDWVGMNAILSNQCPECLKVYSLYHKVCADHIPVVNLKPVEIPI